METHEMRAERRDEGSRCGPGCARLRAEVELLRRELGWLRDEETRVASLLKRVVEAQERVVALLAHLAGQVRGRAEPAEAWEAAEPVAAE